MTKNGVQRSAAITWVKAAQKKNWSLDIHCEKDKVGKRNNRRIIAISKSRCQRFSKLGLRGVKREGLEGLFAC